MTQPLFMHLKEKSIVGSKITYINYGASRHFKNKFNFVNLLYYIEDFNADTELHFYATSYGKGPRDGLEGI